MASQSGAFGEEGTVTAGMIEQLELETAIQGFYADKWAEIGRDERNLYARVSEIAANMQDSQDAARFVRGVVDVFYLLEAAWTYAGAESPESTGTTDTGIPGQPPGWPDQAA